MRPARQKQPAKIDPEPTYCITPFARFRPDGPTAQDFKDALLLGAVESDYLPFGESAVDKLSELYHAALDDRSAADHRTAIPADEGTQLHKLQIQSQKIQDELAKAKQRMAAFHLVDAVSWGITMIETLVSNNPEMMRQIASRMSAWPVQATIDCNWPAIVERLEKLTLAQSEAVQQSEPPFYPAQGDDTLLPARWWAKQAVRCLAQTRDTQKRLAAVPAALFVQRRCKIAPAPEWARKAHALPDFCADKQVLRQWRSLIREMIREQMPDFHNRAEWAEHRKSLKAQGRNIPNGILDLIVATLKTVAPKDPALAASEITEIPHRS